MIPLDLYDFGSKKVNANDTNRFAAKRVANDNFAAACAA